MPHFLLLFRSHPIPQNQCLERITKRPGIEIKITRKPPTKPRFLVNSVTSNQQKHMKNQRRQGFSRGTIYQAANRRKRSNRAKTQHLL
jgi:hypothetical protein